MDVVNSDFRYERRSQTAEVAIARLMNEFQCLRLSNARVRPTVLFSRSDQVLMTGPDHDG